MTKAKKKTFSKVTAVKAAARATVGEPPPAKVLPDAKKEQTRRKEKHKATLSEMLVPDE